MASAAKVGVIGATGAVGVELVKVLHDRKFPLSEVQLFASDRSAGKRAETPFGEATLRRFDPEAANRCDIVFLCVSGEFAREHARKLAMRSLVIDCSSALRLERDVPLVIPEINAGAARGHRLIANPNCTMAVAAMALWPLHQAFRLKKVIVASYQAASGAGAKGMRELIAGAGDYLAGKPVQHAVHAQPLAFNVVPQIDRFEPNGYTREEMKVCWEMRKVFDEPNLPVSCTAVRVPTLRAHAEAITIETEAPITPEAARAVLEKAPGVRVVDDPAEQRYPMPITASERYDVDVGRLRTSLIFGAHGLDLFVCGDQLLKGAALNAVQIAERLV
ncbi:MAG TPA: aspartate-semialdehyde dehydrogenase [Stellaceae bacterium]|nr:aspartate-semialdehyde dehydrogenase [Stellaceae bacterium]